MIKKNGGFTLMEVLLALAILASSSYILSGQQVRSILKLRKSRELVERMYLLKKQLYLFLINPPQSDKPLKIERELPQIKMVAQRKVISKKSSLASVSRSLYCIEATGVWKGFAAEQNATMISFVYSAQPRAVKP